MDTDGRGYIALPQAGALVGPANRLPEQWPHDRHRIVIAAALTTTGKFPGERRRAVVVASA